MVLALACKCWDQSKPNQPIHQLFLDIDITLTILMADVKNFSNFEFAAILASNFQTEVAVVYVLIFIKYQMYNSDKKNKFFLIYSVLHNLELN